LQEAAYRYSGPIDFSFVDDLVAMVGTHGSGRDEAAGIVSAAVHFVYDAVAGAPRHGLPCVMYPVLQSALRALLHSVEAQLLLTPIRTAGSLFGIPTTIWRTVAEEYAGESGISADSGPQFPVKWAAQDTFLEPVQADVWSGERRVPLPCPVKYNEQAAPETLCWCGAYHDLAHHLYGAVIEPDLNADRPQTDELGQFQTSVAELALEARMNRTAGDGVKTIPELWAEEMFADAVALELLQGAYIAVLRNRVLGVRGPSHPPLRLRMAALAHAYARLDQELSEALKHFVASALDEGAEFPEAKVDMASEAQEVMDRLPHYPEYEKTLLDWFASSCMPLVARLVEDRVQASVWPSTHATADEVDGLVALLMDYVLNVGALEVNTSNDGGGTVSVRPASVGAVMLAGAFIRWSRTQLADDFACHWPPNQQGHSDAPGKLSNLMAKAIMDGHLEGGMQHGTDGQRDTPAD